MTTHPVSRLRRRAFALFSSLRRVLTALGTLLLAGCIGLPPVTPQPATYTAAPGAEAVLMKTGNELTLFGQWWKPAGEPKGVVLLVHGTMAHSGFYAPWADYLTTHGYAVFGFDMRGWGQSQGHGRRGYIRDVDEYTEDVALAWREVKKIYPELPLFLQGESLGGAVAVLADIRGELEFQGLVLNAPGIRVNGTRFMPVWLSESFLWGIGTAGEAWPNFPVVPLGNEFLFDKVGNMIIFDEAVKQRAKDDPWMTHSALPVSWLSGLKDIRARAKKGLPKIDTPLIVLQGTKDNLVPLEASERVMKLASSADKTQKVYEGMSHCTLHDFGKEQVWADIVTWLDAHVPAKTETSQQAAVAVAEPMAAVE